MKFFADTAEVKDIQELNDLGLLDGVTTNPSLIAKSGRKFKDVIAEICAIVEGPVSAEVVSLDYEGMMREAADLRKIARNVTIKVPLTLDGLKACKALTSDGCMVNVTLCFSAIQALLAAKAGASYISPFIGRLDDHGADGVGAGDMRIVVDLDAARGLVEAEEIGDAFEQSLLGGAFGELATEGLAGVIDRMLHQFTLFAALRDQDVDLVAGAA